MGGAMTAFGDELRLLRRRSGLSQEALAGQAGLSTEAVSLLERGRRTPRVTTVRLLADALGLDADARAQLLATLASSAPRTSTVPTPAEPLVGRADDLARLDRLIRDPHIRLITVCGAGGVGKTRVSLAAAGCAGNHFGDGVRWVPLGLPSDPTTFLAEACAAVGPPRTREPGVDAIVEHLRGTHQLLLIDNAESLVDEVTQLCAAILQSTENVTLLVTSRHQLQTPGELVYALRPLELPPVGTAAAELGRFAASRLFLTRAGHGQERVADAADAEAVVRICHRLDGLPLALELAAARTSVLTLGELAATLDRTLAILHAAAGASLTDEVVGWSYGLLPPTDRLMFARLGVFAGTFSREDVSAVCAAGLRPVEVLDAVASLLAKSLVIRVDDLGSRARFRVLQVIRAFARERLVESGELEALQERHSWRMLELVEQAAAALAGPGQPPWLDLLETQVSDIRLAVGWFVEHDPVAAQRLAGASWRWCYLRGRYSEGRAWAEAALAAAPSAPVAIRARALSGSGLLAFLQCDYDLARERIEAARRLYAGEGDDDGVAWCQARLGCIARERGAYEDARRLHRESLDLVQASGNAREIGAQLNYLAFVAWLSGEFDEADQLSRQALQEMSSVGDPEGTVWALTSAGVAARCRGDLGGAALLLRQSLELSQAVDYREGIAWSRNQLVVLARLRGDLREARRLQLESLHVHVELGDRWRIASVWDELAAVAAAEHDLTEAVAYLGAADRLRAEIGVPVPLIERADRDRTYALCRAGLGEAFQAAVLASQVAAPDTAI
jgi:predicted ATPase/DNA-binding XRE family transcriptional regulator